MLTVVAIENKEIKLCSIIKIATEAPGGWIFRSVGKESTVQSGSWVYEGLFYWLKASKTNVQVASSPLSL